MAGSRKWFIYQADNDTKFVLQLDESNAEAMGFAAYSATDMAASTLEGEGSNLTITPVPNNLQVRTAYAIAKFTDAVTGNPVTVTKKFAIPTHAKIVELYGAGKRVLPAQDIVYNGLTQSVIFHVTSIFGEQWSNLPTNYDTYQDDGDE